MSRLVALGAAVALALALMPAAAIAAPAQSDLVAVVGGDWPQFQNGPNHPGYNAQETVLSTSSVVGLQKAWTGLTGGVIWGSPVVYKGVVYIGSWDGKLYAYAAACGSGGHACSPLWTADAGASTANKVYSSPAVVDDVVYVGSEDNKLYAFDAGGNTNCSGAPKVCAPLWTALVGGQITSSPAVVDGVVYVGSKDKKLYAFDAAGTTGCSGIPKICTPLWSSAVAGSIFDTSAPAVANGVVYIGSADGKLYTYDANGVTGCSGTPKICTPLWTADAGASTSHGVYSSPAVVNGVVYVGSIDGHLYAFDAAGVTGCSGTPKICTPLWTGAIGASIDISSPAVANGVVYIGAQDGKLYAFAVGCNSGGGSCSPLWTMTTGAGVESSPTVANGVVYVGSNDSKVYAVDAAGIINCSGVVKVCTPLWTFTTGGILKASAPAIANGAVYVGSDDGKLYAFDLEGTYHPITPVRLLDTRVGNGLSGKLTANTPATFVVAGRGGIPSNATAVTGNVTVVNSTNSWAVYLGPVAAASPTTSTINFAAGEVAGNGLTVALGAGGTLSATYMSTAGNTTDLVFDVTGYFTPDNAGGTYHAMDPVRLLDTRVGNGLTGKLVANTPATFQVTGREGIPVNAQAVTGNVTVVNSTFSWAVYLGPDALPSPTTSTINFTAGQVKGNSLTVALGLGGKLSATYMSTAGNTTDLVFDVTGYYTPDGTGARYVPLAPARLVDSRSGNGLATHLSANTPATFQVTHRGGIPANAVAVTGNVTVVNETNSWAIFLGPVATPSPTTSTINFNTGDVKGNGLTVALGAGGKLSATYISTAGNTTDLVFDVTGYFEQ